MQDSYSKIKWQQFLGSYWSIVMIILLMPLLFDAALPILPTHDDWTSMTSPDFSPFFTKEHFFFYGYHWRPFDTWIGYIAGRNPQLLFPAFNHTCVVIGHTLCALLVFQLLSTLRFNQFACNLSTLVFYFTPAAMATVLAVDSQNQVFSLIWSIIAFLCYVRLKKRKYVVWTLLIFMATLSKENGLMWAWICPILAFGFDRIDQKTLKKDLLIGTLMMVGYALAIMVLPKCITIHPDYMPEDFKIVKNFIKFLFTTFITIDYIYILHQPHRNILLAALSFLLTVPFLYYLFARRIKQLCDKQIICTLIALLIAVGPHLITVFSMMHTYAGLALLAVMTGYLLNSYEEGKRQAVSLSFLLFILSAVMIDIHLWQASLQSGLTGKKMAQEAIRKTGKPANRVYVIIIEDDYPKLSSFCVIPNEAFGWGLAAQHETNYAWPKEIQDTTINRSPKAFSEAQSLAAQKRSGNQYDCVWIVNHEHIDVIK